MSGNMKILALFLGLTLAASTGATAQAPGATPPAVPKVGIVAIQAAIANTNEGQKEIAALQQRFAPKQAELKTLNDEVEALKKQLQTQGDKLSDEERGNRIKTLETKQKTLQRNYDDAQSEYQAAEQEIVNRLGTKMLKVMEDYAQKNGYTVIMDVSNPQTPVLYAAQSTNITQQLVDAYNAANPSAAPAPAAPGAKPGANAAPTGPSPKPGASAAPGPKRP